MSRDRNKIVWDEPRVVLTRCSSLGQIFWKRTPICDTVGVSVPGDHTPGPCAFRVWPCKDLTCHLLFSVWYSVNLRPNVRGTQLIVRRSIYDDLSATQTRHVWICIGNLKGCEENPKDDENRDVNGWTRLITLQPFVAKMKCHLISLMRDRTPRVHTVTAFDG